MTKEVVSQKVTDKKPPKIFKRGPRKGQPFDSNGIPVCPANQNQRTFRKLREYSFKN